MPEMKPPDRHLPLRHAYGPLQKNTAMSVAAQIGNLTPRRLTISNTKRDVTMKTDEQLQQDVIDELKWDRAVNASQIGVEVKRGIVTLSGHVGSCAEKWDAERAAQRVSGVRALAIEIDVTLPASSHRTDADIARSVEDTLEWSTYLPRTHVKVMVEGGWITFSGEVDWGYQKQAVVAAVRHLIGIKGVIDKITVSQSVSPKVIKSDIDAALTRHPGIKEQNVSVDVADASVTLSGTAGNCAERELAKDVAWGTTGVHKVVDGIAITW
jgi:osmotically-inducible protein OsmY